MAGRPLLALLVALATLALPLAPVAAAAKDPLQHGARDWPALALATLRPGSLVTSLAGECTTNFVFAGPGNASLYLGTAATCVRGLALGDAVILERGATGRLAYASHLTLEATGVTDAAAFAANDFALVRVDDAHRALVHPAVRSYGGPVALADGEALALGEGLLTHGASTLRPAVVPDARDGIVVGTREATSSALFATPGIMGDMGSPVLTKSGAALGLLTTLDATGTNGVTHLDDALAFAAAHAGVKATLVTWPLLETT